MTWTVGASIAGSSNDNRNDQARPSRTANGTVLARAVPTIDPQ
ncbi:hypothetical protein HSR121_0551 [Halapricum desulfuricans]|uniref:Uncharacterized protein n=1 Tax=Halapricum desulfuricans TaxID=2841257 RepID=A0A897N3M3_9EURY|nr:hypothetical protein HSR121_0551 [Halapricum desulfuricans]